MNSIKNIIVILLLLGVSYGAFQVINAPDPTLQEETPIADLNIEIGDATQFEDFDVPSPPAGETANDLASPPLLGNSKRNPSGDRSEVDGMSQSPPLLGRSQKGPPAFDPLDSQLPELPTPSAASAVAGSDPANAPIGTLQTENEHQLVSGTDEDVSNFDPNPRQLLEPIRPKNGSMIEDEEEISTSLGPIDWPMVDDLVQRGNYRKALSTLSGYYRAELDPQQRSQLNEWLDALAGKVIYSTEHLLERQPYIVQPGDTLESIAADWGVPPQLIQNVNLAKIDDPSALTPGTELKVIQGPFRAELSLPDQELVLFLKSMYAGRFPISSGANLKVEEGVYKVVVKSPQGQVYRDPQGQTIAPGDPNNPYGTYWIGLANNLGIHTAGPASDDPRGSIIIDEAGAEDLFGILSEKSAVKILR